MCFALELECFVIMLQTYKMRNHSLKVLPCTHKVLRILHVNWKSIKWTWAETFEMNAKVKLVLHFIVDNETLLQSLRSLEGE